MPFLVYENDPLVRNDICETLALEFEGEPIAVAETIENLRGLALSLTPPAVAVLALPPDVVTGALGQLDQLAQGIKVVVIGEAPSISDEEASHPFLYLNRPFSSSGLTASIKSALATIHTFG